MKSIHDIIYSELYDLEERGVSIYPIESEIPSITAEIEEFLSEASVATYDNLVGYTGTGKKTGTSFIDGHITALNAFLLLVSAVVTKKLVMLLNKDLRKCAKKFGSDELECIIEAKVRYLKRQIKIIEKNKQTECKGEEAAACKAVFSTNLDKLKKELKSTEIKLATMRLKRKKKINTGSEDE